MFYKFPKKIFLQISVLLMIFFLFSSIKISIAKISDKHAVKTFWSAMPIMPGSAKYFIRTEKIEKKTKTLNNHPIKISETILRRMFKQLSYKYDRDEREIPVFSNKELLLLAKWVPKALMSAKPNEDVTFVIKGPHSSARWSFKEERLTAGRIFVANNQLNLIIGSLQLGLQPTLDERYQGNVWETAKVIYDTGRRNKAAKFDGMIIDYKNQKGIFRKSNERKDWLIFTNTAYKAAKEDINAKQMSKDQYKTLQQQIDTLQKQVKQPTTPSSPPQRQIQQREKKPVILKKQTNNKVDPHVIEQRLKTIENLYKKGMLSEKEYQKKRNEILKGI